MKTSTIYLIIGLFVAIITGMVIFTVLAKKSMDSDEIILPATNEQDVIINSYGIERIEAKHFYIKGTHTIVGSMMMPTPCDLLEGNALIAESMPEQITFAFDVINTTQDCAQVVTEQRFRIDAIASESATMRATFMGEEVELNLVPAGADESPEDFELHIKG